MSVGAAGEPSSFLDKKPAWKRLLRGLISKEVSGAVGIGEELGGFGEGMKLGSVGAAASMEDIDEVVSSRCGVF